jgi:hypothetical protein
VMLPYALDKRNAASVKRLLSYLKSCKDFTGGHACAALGMCHAAILFATIDEYEYFWKLHGADILDRQKEDGSFTPLPAGERTPEERGGDLSDAFHTLTLALPDAPWKWGQTGLPATSYGGYDAIIARAKAATEMGGQPPSMAKLAAINPQDRPNQLATNLTTHLHGLLRETKETKDQAWLPLLLDPYALCEVVGKSKGRVEVNMVIPPLVVSAVDAEARLMLSDRVLAQTKFRPDAKKALTRRLLIREDASASDVTLQIKWTWGGKSFTTSHPLVEAVLEAE